jgi:hypothetical protein
MGLDMYLVAGIHLSEYNETENTFSEIIKENGIYGLNRFTPNYIKFDVGYWRKANAIHKWFVENVQDGKDDCDSYYVSVEQLKTLKEACQKVLSDADLAPELLPSASGFFFGSTEYSSSYMDQLYQTIEIVDRIISNPFSEKWIIKYQSSW